MASAALDSLWAKAQRFAEKRLPALTRYRQAESLPINLHSRRIYILPSRFGLFFALVVGAMVLGALNFNNNPALLFCFLVVAVSLVSFHHTVGNLRGISLTAVRAKPVHAGQPVQLECVFRESDGRARPGLVLDQDQAECRGALLAHADTVLRIELPTNKRGLMHPGRFRLWSEYPFGIVWTWSVLHPDRTVLIYPRAEQDAPALPYGADDDFGSRMRSPGEDWQGLREYRPSDPPRHIAWKQSAHAENLLVKEFADPVSDAIALDWNDLGAMDPESRIARLTAWVLEAQNRGLSFRLRLPNKELGPGSGEDFLAECLTELALLP